MATPRPTRRTSLFLITFTDEIVAPERIGNGAATFELLDESVYVRRVEVAARPNQQRFKFDVIARYGAACAVCDIDAPEVLDAVHLADKASKGSDHAQNGLVLCATHHRAFDRGLFCIDPATYAIHLRPGAGDLRLTRSSVAHLKAYPHAHRPQLALEALVTPSRRDRLKHVPVVQEVGADDR